jgi:hypothetical protein
LCGKACTNLDIQLLSPIGKVVASDMEADSTPIASFTPAKSGDYTVRVVMTGCSASPCAFVTKAFTKK